MFGSSVGRRHGMIEVGFALAHSDLASHIIFPFFPRYTDAIAGKSLRESKRCKLIRKFIISGTVRSYHFQQEQRHVSIRTQDDERNRNTKPIRALGLSFSTPLR